MTVFLVVFAVGLLVGLAMRRGTQAPQPPCPDFEADEVEQRMTRLNERISVLERIQTDEDYALWKKFSRFKD